MPHVIDTSMAFGNLLFNKKCFNFSYSQNLIIEASDLLENIVSGSTTVTITDRSRLAGEPYSASFIKASGIVIQVSEENLCSK